MEQVSRCGGPRSRFAEFVSEWSSLDESTETEMSLSSALQGSAK